MEKKSNIFQLIRENTIIYCISGKLMGILAKHDMVPTQPPLRPGNSPQICVNPSNPKMTKEHRHSDIAHLRRKILEEKHNNTFTTARCHIEMVQKAWHRFLVPFPDPPAL